MKRHWKNDDTGNLWDTVTKTFVFFTYSDDTSYDHELCWCFFSRRLTLRHDESLAPCVDLTTCFSCRMATWDGVVHHAQENSLRPRRSLLLFFWMALNIGGRRPNTMWVATKQRSLDPGSTIPFALLLFWKESFDRILLLEDWARRSLRSSRWLHADSNKADVLVSNEDRTLLLQHATSMTRHAYDAFTRWNSTAADHRCRWGMILMYEMNDLWDQNKRAKEEHCILKCWYHL